MWILFIGLALSGYWLAKNHHGQPEINVTPKTPAPTPPSKSRPVLRLVKAMKNAVAYPHAPMVETIALGKGQTIAPLLDPSLLDEQAAQMRMTGNILEADRLTKLADEVRLAITKKYNTDPSFKARVANAAAKKKAVKKTNRA